MRQQTAEQTASEEGKTQWFWIFVALVAHAGWGAYPVLARYLQTVSRLPSMSLLAAGNFVVLLIFAVTLLPRTDTRALRLPLLWFFGLMVVVRGVTNLLAARYTLSIYVQLITQMTPFLVSLLSTVLLRESLPRFTGRAISLCLAGALLMMSGNVGEINAAAVVTRNDWLGIALAITSSLALAIYMILVRRTVRHQVSGEALLLIHLLALFTFSISASLLAGENWSQWQRVGPADWLVFAAFSVGVLLGANLGQINALRHLGAPLVSSMLAGRLVSALAVGALLLGERLTSLWQLLGAGVVLVTITWYLRQQ